MKSRIDYLFKKNKLPQAMMLVGKKQWHTLKHGFYIVSKLLGEKIEQNSFHPDFKYICVEEKKKNISIEQIREAKGFCSLSPQMGDNKVVMINDAELMTVAAANSLLKILEEPHDNRYFILITENKDQLLPTILSRCVIFRVKPLLEQSSSMFLRNDDFANKLLNIFGSIDKKSFSITELVETFNQGCKDYSGFENFLKALISLNSYILEEEEDYDISRINIIESLMNVLPVLRLNISEKFLITMVAMFFSEKRFTKGVLNFE
jgi:hypothetical protein